MIGGGGEGILVQNRQKLTSVSPHVHSQDFVDLGDDVLRGQALPLQGHAVAHTLVLEAAELDLGQGQAHAALLPEEGKGGGEKRQDTRERFLLVMMAFK